MSGNMQHAVILFYGKTRASKTCSRCTCSQLDRRHSLSVLTKKLSFHLETRKRVPCTIYNDIMIDTFNVLLGKSSGTISTSGHAGGGVHIVCRHTYVLPIHVYASRISIHCLHECMWDCSGTTWMQRGEGNPEYLVAIYECRLLQTC